MKILKKILWVLVAVFVFIQFYPSPKNNTPGSPKTAIAMKFTVPPDVDEILRTSCYDCHSDVTIYPWYAHVQPAEWWLAGHIRDGKRKLNFDEFATYKASRQYQKFGDIKAQISEGEMPLSSYTLIHRYAILNDNLKSRIYHWTEVMRDTMKMRYPADSLKSN